MGKHKRILFSVLLALMGPLFTAPGVVLAQDLLEDSGKVVTLEAFPSMKPIPRKEGFQIGLLIKIKEGWHINGHEGLPEGFVPLEVDPGPGSRLDLIAPAHYPLGVLRSLGGSEKPLPVYEKEARVILRVKLKDIPYKEPRFKVPFRVKVQACNDKVCLRPAVVTCEADITVPAPGQEPAPANFEFFNYAEGSAAGREVPSDNIILKILTEKGVLLTFLLIFLGGLALNLTPCVYPMIPITISYFGNQKAERPVTILARAAAYVVGISLTYSTLGVTAALTGKILGSTLQSPWVLCGISILLVVLSLSMFGFYEIQAPSWLLDKAASGNAGGWLGALGMGLVFGIVAAPCVDPFSIGLLTFVAAKANPYLGFVMFFTLSLGLGFPYLWLGFFSSNLQKLPKSGMWMVWVKKVFGLVLLGMPFYFLNPLLPKDSLHWALPGYLVLCGCLLGWVFSGKGVTIGFQRFQHAFGLSLIVLGIAVFQAWPRPLELPFKAYDKALLEEAKSGHRAVFIDFTASWCLPCKELEVKTFSDPRVHKALEGWVLLKADLSQYSSAPVEELKKGYGIMGVPTLVFLGADGMERTDLRAIGFINADEMLRKIGQISK